MGGGEVSRETSIGGDSVREQLPTGREELKEQSLMQYVDIWTN